MKKIINLLSLFLFVQSLGQAQNPTLVKDIAQTPQKWVGSIPQTFKKAGGKIFFLADDGSDVGLEMWRSDGTEAGTELIGDLNSKTTARPFTNQAPFTAAVDFRNNAYWLSKDDGGIHLWKAGATGNAQKIEDLPTGNLQYLVVSQNKLFITINGKIWASNGNPNEANLIFDGNGGRIANYRNVGNRLYFTHRIFNGNNRLLDEVEMWSTDGTAAGTVFYKKVVGDAPTDCGEYTVQILDFNGQVAYALRPGRNCNQVSWLFVEGFNPIMETPNLSLGLNFIVIGNKIYYISNTNLKVFENGTTRIVKTFPGWVRDLRPLPSGEMIFETSAGFWRSDGTDAGTVLFFDGSRLAILYEFLPYQNGYFFSDTKDDKVRFWKTDGTNAGTIKIAEFPHVFEQFDPYYVVNNEVILDNYLYFGDSDGQIGAELWRLDLDAAPTVLPNPTSRPGLSIDEVQTASTVNLDEPTDVVFDIINSGDAPVVGDISVGLYISKDFEFTSQAVFIGEVIVSDLAIGEVKKITAQYTLPDNLEHLERYSLLVYADYKQLIGERDETNNVVYRNLTVFDTNAPKVDLQPIVRNMPFSGNPGAVLFADVRARNNGTEDSPSSSTGLYFSTDRTLTPDDLFLGENITGTVDAGATSDQRSIRFTVPSVPDGDYFLISVIDYQEAIAEFDETNNIAVTSFKTPPPVDLQLEVAWIRNFTFPVGYVFTDFLVFNFGNELAPFFRIGAYLSTDDTFSPDDVFLEKQYSFNPLFPGDSFDGQIQFKIPSNVAAGDYYILIYADDEEEILESDESNNVFAIPYTYTPIPKVDLELSFDDLADPDPKRWSFFSPVLTVENNGSDLAENIEIQVPRPSDVIYSGGNEYVASQGSIKVYSSDIWRVGDLASGESATLQLNYFRMESDPFPVYAQVLSVDQIDDDSTPDNGSCCIANEDDEAVLQVEVAPPTFVRRNGSNANAITLFDIQVSPNPFKNQFVAEVISEESTSLELSIFDVAGKVIWRKPVELQKGYNSISIDGSDLPSGVLMLRTSPAKPYWQSIRLVKQR